MCLGISACQGSSGAKEDKETKELNILTWAGYVPDEIVSNFELENGIKVNYSNFSTNEEMMAMLQNQKNQYDIVICSDYIIDVMVKEGGLIQKLDKSQIPNFKNIDPGYQSKYYDKDNEYTVPYAGAAAILVYDSAQVDFPVTSYNDLWNESLEKKVVLLNSDRDIIGLTALSMGYSVNETDEAKLNEIQDKMMSLRKNVVSFDADTPFNAIINGDASVGFMFPSQAIAAKAEVPTVEVAFPEEGITFYIDNIVVAEGAPNRVNAYKFIDYVLDGQVSAQISMLINYPSTNTAATPFLSEEFKSNPAINIPPDIMKKASIFEDLGDATVIYDKIWTEFKSK